jgi:hypothetical protein
MEEEDDMETLEAELEDNPLDPDAVRVEVKALQKAGWYRMTPG